MLYIQDRQNKTLGVVSDYYNDTHQMILSSGLSSYTFTIAKNIKDVEHLIEGNYVVVTDDSGIGWKFTIMNTTQTHSEITLYCEDIGLELINKVMDSWVAPSTKQPVSYYINKAIKDTQWEIGINEIEDLSRTLLWEGRDTSLNRLLSIATQFDNSEIEFRVRFKNLQVTDYLINIYKKRGADRSDIQLVYGDTVNDITKTSSIEELATALMGVGSDKELPENSPAEAVADKTTFKDLTYDDGLFFTKAGDKFLRARVANQQFNLKEGYIEDFYEYDTADPQELLNRTITQLKERSEIKVNYEVSVAKFEKTLQLGDTITIIDHDYKPELLLHGRVLEMDKSYTDPSNNTLVLGNFLILYSNINDRLTNLQNQIKNMKVDSNYMWLRYAIDDKGTGMSATPTAGTKYFAMLVNKKTGIPSDNPADYAGHWKLIQGADGSQGTPGKPGTDGKTPYLHTAYSWSADGTDRFMTVYPGENLLTGTKAVKTGIIKAGSQSISGYSRASVSIVGGETYTYSVSMIEMGHTAHSSIAWLDANKSVLSAQPGADYPWAANGGRFSNTFTAPSNAVYASLTPWYFSQAYTPDTNISWNQEKFELGTTPTPYTPSPLDDPDGAYPTFIGTYTDYIAEDSTDPSKYTWAKMRGEQGPKGDTGEDGVAGKDGVGLKSTQIMYAQSTSGTTAPTTGWTAQVPTLIKGQYLWTQTTWLYTDSTGEAGYTVSYNAKDGNSGANGIAGKDGVGIKSTAITYAQSTSGTVAPTTGYTTTVPSVASGSFLWTKTTWSYTDGTSESGYSVAKMGEKGAQGPQGLQGLQGATGNQGIQGPKGLDGKSSYTHIAYGTSNSGAGFTQTPSTLTTYIGMYVDQTATDSADPSKYAWSLIKGADGTQGTPGAKGADGKTPYFHSAWANSADGKTGFSTTDSVNKSYLGTYTDFTVEDSADPTKYAWSLIKGADGINGKDGIPGKAGTDGKTPYFHTAWADSADGKINFSLTDATNRGYLGTYTDFTQADSTDTTKYAWSLIKGRDGSDGAPGKAGTDGKTPYFHQAWADSKDGKINFSTTDPTNRGYLGTYSDFTQADSTDPTKYSWVELVGAFEVGGINLIVRKDELVNRMIGPTGTIDQFAGSSVTKNIISVEPGKYLTMTRYNSAADNNFRFAFYDASGAVVKRDYNSDWSHTEEVPPKSATFRISYNTNLIVKLVRGRKSSEYTPAPEDTQKQIDSINNGLADTNSKIAAVTKVDSQATAPTDPKKGDQWWVKDANGNINAFKIWDGTKWADSIIQQSAMNIGTLNGNIINGATINGSEFTNNFDYTGLDNNHFQGVTQIKDGSVNINWKIPENNQTGHTSLDASGLESIVRDPNGTLIRSARLQMGELQLGDGRVSGWLNEQDVYQNYTNQVQYLDGWSGWNNPISITRRGRMVTFSGYIAHNGGSAHINIAQFPAWARPEHTEFIVEIHFAGDTGERTNGYGNLMLSTGGRLIINRGLGTGQHASFGYTFVGQDI